MFLEASPPEPRTVLLSFGSGLVKVNGGKRLAPSSGLGLNHLSQVCSAADLAFLMIKERRTETETGGKESRQNLKVIRCVICSRDSSTMFVEPLCFLHIRPTLRRSVCVRCCVQRTMIDMVSTRSLDNPSSTNWLNSRSVSRLNVDCWLTHASRGIRRLSISLIK